MICKGWGQEQLYLREQQGQGNTIHVGCRCPNSIMFMYVYGLSMTIMIIETKLCLTFLDYFLLNCEFVVYFVFC